MIQVTIHLKRFDLKIKDEAVGFLLEMFNLASLLGELADELDPLH
jgi:hypothetical protein